MKGNIKKVNNFKYSRVSFEDYKLRAILKLTSKSVEHKVEFYTSNPDKVEALKGFKTFIKDVVDNVEVVHWATKAQDDNTSAFIDEFIGFS